MRRHRGGVSLHFHDHSGKRYCGAISAHWDLSPEVSRRACLRDSCLLHTQHVISVTPCIQESGDLSVTPDRLDSKDHVGASLIKRQILIGPLNLSRL